ncbi:MAG: hypothetical protein AB7F88_03875 [Pyrinomonadaceae bacterium]
MSMRNFSFILVLAFAALAIGCGSEAPANSSNTNRTSTNAPAANTNSPVAVTTPTPDQVTNNAPTLTPVYKAYCAAVVKKDDAAVRKFFTADTLQSFEEGMKDEGIKSISSYVDKVTNEVCEVSNERLKGDKAVAKVKTVSYPNGFDVLFIKENGEWKMSNIDPAKGFE